MLAALCTFTRERTLHLHCRSRRAVATLSLHGTSKLAFARARLVFARAGLPRARPAHGRRKQCLGCVPLGVLT